MKREVDLKEITDGRLYGYNDMVKADAGGCVNCHLCCTGMGESIVLDPYDVWRIQKETGKGLMELLAENLLELHVVDGCTLPNLKMQGPEEACAFLNAEGRCSIHKARPGICRLFPLGRIYENGDFKFILQKNECAISNLAKVKVGKWIDTPLQKQNHDFLCKWHYLLNAVEDLVKASTDEEVIRGINMEILTVLYRVPGENEMDFYHNFEVLEKDFREKYFS